MKITALLVLKVSGAAGSSETAVLANASDVSQFGFFQRQSAREFIVFASRTIAGRTPLGQRQSVAQDGPNCPCPTLSFLLAAAFCLSSSRCYLTGFGFDSPWLELLVLCIILFLESSLPSFSRIGIVSKRLLFNWSSVSLDCPHVPPFLPPPPSVIKPRVAPIHFVPRMRERERERERERRDWQEDLAMFSAVKDASTRCVRHKSCPTRIRVSIWVCEPVVVSSQYIFRSRRFNEFFWWSGWWNQSTWCIVTTGMDYAGLHLLTRSILWEAPSLSSTRFFAVLFLSLYDFSCWIKTWKWH